MDEKLKNILKMDIVQDIPIIHIIKVYMALIEVEENERIITGIRQE